MVGHSSMLDCSIENHQVKSFFQRDFKLKFSTVRLNAKKGFHKWINSLCLYNLVSIVSHSRVEVGQLVYVMSDVENQSQVSQNQHPRQLRIDSRIDDQSLLE